MRRLVLLPVLLALAVPASAAAVGGGDTYVDQGTGHDAANDCSNMSNPCKTVVQGISQAGNGHKVFVNGGHTYASSLTLSDGKSLVHKNFAGAGGKAILDNGNAASPDITVTGAGGNVTGFTIRSNDLPVLVTAPAILERDTFDESSQITEEVLLENEATIERCRFTDPTPLDGPGTSTTAVVDAATGNNVVLRSKFTGFSTAIAAPQGVLLAKANKISGTHDGATNGSGIVISGNAFGVVSRNTLQDPDFDADSVGMADFSSMPSKFENNLVEGYHTGIESYDAAPLKLASDAIITPATNVLGDSVGLSMTDTAADGAGPGDVAAENVTITGRGTAITQAQTVLKPRFESPRRPPRDSHTDHSVLLDLLLARAHEAAGWRRLQGLQDNEESQAAQGPLPPEGELAHDRQGQPGLRAPRRGHRRRAPGRVRHVRRSSPQGPQRHRRRRVPVPTRTSPQGGNHLKRLVLAPVLLALALPASASASDTYVDQGDGADAANDCSNPATPCRTIVKGIAQAGSGDTVFVGGGETYTASLTLDSGKSLVQKDFSTTPSVDTSGEATLDSGAATDVTITGVLSTVSGFTIQAVTTGIDVQGPGVKISGNHVDSSSGAIGVLINATSSGGTVNNNRFTNSDLIDNSFAVYVSSSASGFTEVKGNTMSGWWLGVFAIQGAADVAGNTFSAPHDYTGTPGAAINVQSVARVTIEDDTIDETASHGVPTASRSSAACRARRSIARRSRMRPTRRSLSSMPAPRPAWRTTQSPGSPPRATD